MRKLINRLRYFNIEDIFAPFIFLFILPFSLFFRLFNKIKNRRLWLICEDGLTARDNGYHFYKYIRNNYPDDYCFFVIDKKATDFKKVADFGNIIQFKSFKHWLFYLSAEYNISNHKHGNPCQSFFYIIHVILRLFNNRIFLQHGVIKDDLPFVYYKNARFKMFITSAKREYDYICENFGYPDGIIKNFGLARFDNLHDYVTDNKRILFMPTWRNWLGNNHEIDKDRNLFKQTNFYIYWNELLSNKIFINYIEKNNIIVYFYPHQHMQKYLDLFNTSSDNIKIVDNSDVDIQDLLKSSPLLVTDYSSVFMDFGYMNKPVLYYQFDREEFRKNHMSKGYFDYDDDGFGKCVFDSNVLVEEIIKLVDNGFRDEKVYEERRLNFFEFRDSNNCKRTYDYLLNRGE